MAGLAARTFLTMLVVFDLRAIQVATGILASFGIGEACPARAVSTS